MRGFLMVKGLVFLCHIYCKNVPVCTTLLFKNMSFSLDGNLGLLLRLELPTPLGLLPTWHCFLSPQINPPSPTFFPELLWIQCVCARACVQGVTASRPLRDTPFRRPVGAMGTEPGLGARLAPQNKPVQVWGVGRAGAGHSVPEGPEACVRSRQTPAWPPPGRWCGAALEFHGRGEPGRRRSLPCSFRG